jgi:benzoyl-CoA reductase/2-hydroxyglutaryl-CoA dehydratase subunit BcrC/BadD/HgdB
VKIIQAERTTDMAPAGVIGITSTLPVEIIYSAGYKPVDINNLFISSPDPGALVRLAKAAGFPDTTCSWICGLYGAIMENKIGSVAVVTGGDCAESIALMEVLSMKGIKIFPFAYPASRDREKLSDELIKFSSLLGTDIARAESFKGYLDKIRERIHLLDEMMWKENRAFGEEVHLFELSSSDFEGDPDGFHAKLEDKIAEAAKRDEIKTDIRLGYVGVPPIIKDLYGTIERDGVRIVYNEVQRQFSLPKTGSLIESYYHYTYPYGIYSRIADIEAEIKRRRIDGIIHYVQSFCYRGIEDIVLREKLPVPILTLQGDIPSRVTETMDIRIEAFIDIISRRKKACS